MIKVTETYHCDVCHNEIEKTQIKLSVKIPVVFLTEQTEGKSIKPHLVVDNNIDMCQPCLEKYVSEFPLVASGAMGYNTYVFKK